LSHNTIVQDPFGYRTGTKTGTDSNSDADDLVTIGVIDKESRGHRLAPASGV